MNTQDVMLQNFVLNYGFQGLVKITNLFVEQVSNQTIAKEFGVTRQRVHQWQRAFTKTGVSLKPHVRKVLTKKG